MMLDSLLLHCVKKKLCSNRALLYKARSGCGRLPLDRSKYIPLEVKVIVMKQNYNWGLFVCLVIHFDLRLVASFWSQTSTCLSVADIWFYFSFVQEGFRYHQAKESYMMLTYWVPEEPYLPVASAYRLEVGHCDQRSYGCISLMCLCIFIYVCSLCWFWWHFF